MYMHKDIDVCIYRNMYKSEPSCGGECRGATHSTRGSTSSASGHTPSSRASLSSDRNSTDFTSTASAACVPPPES